MRRLMSALMVLSLSVLCACAAPPTDSAQAAAPQAPTQVHPATPAEPAAPTPAQGVTGVSVPAVVRIDRSCRSDADCTVKNVGNCCGAMPACVNVNSPTDPAGVQAECARSGRMSVCGFKAIESCQCSEGQCRDNAEQVKVN